MFAQLEDVDRSRKDVISLGGAEDAQRFIVGGAAFGDVVECLEHGIEGGAVDMRFICDHGAHLGPHERGEVMLRRVRNAEAASVGDIVQCGGGAMDVLAGEAIAEESKRSDSLITRAKRRPVAADAIAQR